MQTKVERMRKQKDTMSVTILTTPGYGTPMGWKAEDEEVSGVDCVGDDGRGSCYGRSLTELGDHGGMERDGIQYSTVAKE